MTVNYTAGAQQWLMYDGNSQVYQLLYINDSLATGTPLTVVSMPTQGIVTELTPARNGIIGSYDFDPQGALGSIIIQVDVTDASGNLQTLNLEANVITP